MFQLLPADNWPKKDKGIIAILLALDWTSMAHTNWFGNALMQVRYYFCGSKLSKLNTAIDVTLPYKTILKYDK